MRILHLDLEPIGNDYAQFRFFWDNPNDYQSCQRPLAEIKEQIERAERDYYTRLPEDYAKTGQALYNWLDGRDRIFQLAINQHRREDIVIAIAAREGLAHLPWEVLHDGQRFLVERRPAIIPVRWKADSRQLTWDNQPKNRALNVLFMATSPLGFEPELNFEAEEGEILKATQRIPLSLTVEESGCLSELGYLAKGYGQGHFDVLHLTGHATSRIYSKDHATSGNPTPCFMTETELGDRIYSRAEDIADELSSSLPKLIFLSGCRTGKYWEKGTVPAMAEQLLDCGGASAVLSWGERVLDTNATAAAETLYKSLSAGETVSESVAKTYQTLIKNQARDWHLLRLYVADTLPSALVTPSRTPGRQTVPRISVVAYEFLDFEGKVRVATRENFVGRRRQLQNCLRILKTPNQEIGVLIHGMGGLGKSAIAARLCDRLSDHQKIVWWRQIDESSLVSKLKDYLDKPEQRAIFQGNEELKFQLKRLFNQLTQENKHLLLVFDDFEWNLEPRQGEYVLKPEVAKVLRALVEAITKIDRENNHRIIITCRYDFESDLLQNFFKQPLEGLRKTDLQKKLKYLNAFNADNLDNQLVERALQLADGNPRLLEWLNDEVISKTDAELQLSQIENSSQEWKGKIIWDELYKQIDTSLKKILGRCLIFEIPVPMPAFEAVCEDISDYKQQLDKAIKLGLIEISPDPDKSNRLYRVSRILPEIIFGLQVSVEEISSLSRKASDKLYQLYRQKNTRKEQWREVFRLGLADKDNPHKFIQQFFKILDISNPYNQITAHDAYQSSISTTYHELKNLSYAQLEEYLKQGRWKDADRCTAWIFYINRYWECDVKKVNQLWVKYRGDWWVFNDVEEKVSYFKDEVKRINLKIVKKDEDGDAKVIPVSDETPVSRELYSDFYIFGDFFERLFRARLPCSFLPLIPLFLCSSDFYRVINFRYFLNNFGYDDNRVRDEDCISCEVQEFVFSNLGDEAKVVVSLLNRL